MNSVIDIDVDSGLARIQAGALGPHLEAQLAAQGWTIGHFPDSFTHSTIGGWAATRSSGMQSDKYGDIADIARGLRVVRPGGTLVVRPHPSASNGPSVRVMILSRGAGAQHQGPRKKQSNAKQARKQAHDVHPLNRDPRSRFSV